MSQEKITELTPEQEAKFPEYRKKWLDIGLSTSECNFKEAVKAAKKSYKLAGLTPPKDFLLFDSPQEAIRYTAMIEMDLATIEDLAKGDRPFNSLDEKTKEKVITKSKDYISWNVYGSHDAGWLSFYDFFLQEFDLECCKKLEGLIELSRHCGWWIPCEEVCILQHKPSEIHMDEENRLHNDQGAAIKYRDGYSVYAVHGVRVPADIIEDRSSITVARIEAEENAEVRRVMIEFYGLEKYVLDSGAKEIHKDEFGILYRKELNDDEPIVMVKVVNSTPEPDGSFKDYFLRVPPEIETAQSAVAWTFGVDEDEYAPLAET